MATNENLPPNVVKQLAKELKNLDENPPEGIKVVINDDDFSTIFADIEGPAGTPYENGVFRMKLLLSHDFPQSPPKGYFLTKIFHPNIASNGEICVNTLKKDWNPTLGLRHVLLVVRCLLIEPFPESALNEQAGKMLLENYEEYARHAKLYTGIHAHKPKPKMNNGAISESTTALNIELKNKATGDDAIQQQIPLGNRVRAVNGQNQHVAASALTETATAPTGLASTIKDGVNLAGVSFAAKSHAAADKKKMDARKKSLKRL